jgi:hypothetical protein
VGGLCLASDLLLANLARPDMALPVGLALVGLDLLLCAKHLFVAAGVTTDAAV